MAHIGDDGDGRSSTVDLNLVPIIDLMSTCISFLLITAVWTQVSMIQIGSSIYGKKTATGLVEEPKREQIMLKIDVTHSGYVVNLGHQAFSIPRVNDEYDQASLVS